MKIHILDPLVDSRWDEFVAHHPSASVFHDRGWLEALTRTYGFEPYVLTSSPFNVPLENGIVVCRVSSWMTGARLVSLPFSDHCEPLLRECDAAQEFIHWLQDACEIQQWRYVELRPLSAPCSREESLQPSSSYWFHELDLEPSLDRIFSQLHRNSFQRKVQRAEREQLTFETGRAGRIVDEFYRLLLNTRRRHQLLPQPKVWFSNLVECMGDKLLIRLVLKNGVAIAAMLTLRHGSTVVYKYGCSNERFHNLGGMPLLFWRLIEESKASGVEKIDLGRTDLNNEGLIAFKDRLGTIRRLLTYYRYTRTPKLRVATLSDSRALRQFFAFLPNGVCSLAGRILYKHLG